MIPSGKCQLEARLVLPASIKGKVPIVIFLAGSGEGSFEGYLPEQEKVKILNFEKVFLPRGIGICYFNKRGIGHSTGNWKKRNFEQRAEDVHNVVEFLCANPSIDTGKIGLVGHSQGGWVAQILAVQNSTIAFIINVAGPTVGVWEQNLQDSQSDYECLSLSEAAIQKELKKRVRNLKLGRALGKIFPFGGIGYWSRIANYNSDQYIKQIKCPTLFLFAENDSMVPPQPNIDHLINLFDGQVPDNFKTIIIPQTDHFFHIDNDTCFDFPETMNKAHSEIFYQKLDQFVANLF